MTTPTESVSRVPVFAPTPGPHERLFHSRSFCQVVIHQVEHEYAVLGDEPDANDCAKKADDVKSDPKSDTGPIRARTLPKTIAKDSLKLAIPETAP